jgi:hypothetical protein
MVGTSIPYAEINYGTFGAAMRVPRRTRRGLRAQHYKQALTAERVTADVA